MAANTNPIFPKQAAVGAVSVSTANTNRDGTGTIATVITAGADGTAIEELVVKADGNPADSAIVWYLVLDSGPTFHVYDEWDIGDPAAGSATVASYRESRLTPNLKLPSGWSLRASITAAPTSGVVKCIALGGDY